MTAPTADGLARWSQLTYTSADSGDGSPGGWGVKDTVGAFTDAELDLAKRFIPREVRELASLTAFPTPEQIAKLPPRLTYRQLSNDLWAFISSAPAGSDSTGRPGNVFTQVAFDRRARDKAPYWRPIALWRSQDWLRPYGPKDVSAAHLARRALPLPGSMVAPRTIQEFLFADGALRVDVLLPLLDAVGGAMANGTLVVLFTSDPDEAAMWIGALSLFMGGAVAERFSWCTFGSALDVIGEEPPTLLCLPQDEAPQVAEVLRSLDQSRFLLLDVDEDVEQGVLDGKPNRSGTRTFAVTEWSVMVRSLLMASHDLARLAAEIDQMSDALRGVRIDPAIPIAMAVGAAGDGVATPGRDAAGRVLLSFSPKTLDHNQDLLRNISSVAHRAMGSSAADALRLLEQIQADPERSQEMRRLVSDVYVERALGDTLWLTGSVPPAVPDQLEISGIGRDRVLSQLRSVLGRAVKAKSVETNEEALRALAFFTSVDHRIDPLVLAEWEPFLAEEIAPALLCAEGERLRRAGDELAGEYRDVLADALRTRPELVRSLGSPGHRLEPELLQWLNISSPGNDDPLVPPSPTDADVLLLDVATQGWLSTRRPEPGEKANRIVAWVTQQLLCEYMATGRRLPSLDMLFESPWHIPDVERLLVPLVAASSEGAADFNLGLLLPTALAGPGSRGSGSSICDWAHRTQPPLGSLDESARLLFSLWQLPDVPGADPSPLWWRSRVEYLNGTGLLNGERAIGLMDFVAPHLAYNLLSDAFEHEAPVLPRFSGGLLRAVASSILRTGWAEWLAAEVAEQASRTLDDLVTWCCIELCGQNQVSWAETHGTKQDARLRDLTRLRVKQHDSDSLVHVGLRLAANRMGEADLFGKEGELSGLVFEQAASWLLDGRGRRGNDPLTKRFEKELTVAIGKLFAGLPEHQGLFDKMKKGLLGGFRGQERS